MTTFSREPARAGAAPAQEALQTHVRARHPTGSLYGSKTASRNGTIFADSVVHPAATDLIFYSDKYFRASHEPSAEEIVDKALAYKPIEMEPGS